ncbi:helix-turn-helix domain-containing protein [Mangrovicoccus ximenensis]|uniref:helix-turn-helix domain-containing protein n=1 Tax=Mangrovicoccus ximenensis TaxID=1911570 RepID=UPI001F42577F|nr:helix-turn-helix domain-containing protein [Mangrovicoccus ximenensis]
MPRAWLQLAISPQAKTLLLAFCGFADAKGESWHSYEELGRLLNRSKSSISAYVAELREHGLIDCIRQTYGNGYNYRLRVVVSGWQEMCSRWSAMAAGSGKPSEPKAERSVRDAERKDPKGPKNKIHKNNTVKEWSPELEAEWRQHRPSDSDPVGVWHGTARTGLLQHVIAEAENMQVCLWDEAQARQQATAALGAFSARHGLAPEPEARLATAALLASHARSAEALAAAIAALDAIWQPHWKKLPLPRQLVNTVAAPAAAAMPGPADLKRIGRFRNRAWIAKQQLRKQSVQGHVPAGTGPVAEGQAA